MSSDPTLRELATKAITDACPTEEQCHSAAALSTAGDCLSAHPIHVSGESNGAIFLVEGEPAALADVVLAAILPVYREQVLREGGDRADAALSRAAAAFRATSEDPTLVAQFLNHFGLPPDAKPAEVLAADARLLLVATGDIDEKCGRPGCPCATVALSNPAPKEE
jgi:hypothetical protein